ncbi:putative inorganic phosphate cotransporter [Portunus trituberculatus]|uniref:putative inorganic phosphate cotransporter n=1 Tax=Portunus trituberculatus TaxID=210409 RepID=UPI001E1D006E|nr:putative inorganic phosphate cotransporter [Portunus trituberculatus]
MEDSFNGLLQRLCGCIPARMSMGALAFMGFVMMTSVRINLSVAIVAMVRQNSSSVMKGRVECQQAFLIFVCAYEFMFFDVTIDVMFEINERELGGAGTGGGQGGNSTTAVPWDIEMMEGDEDEGLEWDEITQGLVLASFFYGYIFTQIIGGRFAEMYGTRITFGLCGLTSGFFTLLSPIAARYHYGAFIAVRALMGFFQGPMWPSMHALVPRWIPPFERSRFVSSVYFGSNLSMMMTMALSGIIVDSLGWDAAFYIPGTICLAWALCWFLLVADTPSQHPRISHEEKEYIESAVRKSGSSWSRPKKVPWRSLLTCVAFWVTVAVDVGNMFGLTIFFSHLPTYMKNVLGFSIKENGLLSSLPFLFRYLGALSFSFFGDWIISSGKLSVITSRRLSSAIAMFFPAVLCLATAYSGCSAIATVTFLCLMNYTNGAVVNSILINYTEIAPNFSGTIFGIGNTAGAITMFLAPVCVGAVIQGQQTMLQWRKVFWMCVPLYVVPEVFYLIFSSATVQPWNSAWEEDEEQTASLNNPSVKT